MSRKLRTALQGLTAVAWRWRYYGHGRRPHWIVRQSPIVPSKPSPGLCGVEVEALYAASEVESLLSALNDECERAWKAYRIAHDQAMANGSALAAARNATEQAK